MSDHSAQSTMSSFFISVWSGTRKTVKQKSLTAFYFTFDLLYSGFATYFMLLLLFLLYKTIHPVMNIPVIRVFFENVVLK